MGRLIGRSSRLLLWPMAAWAAMWLASPAAGQATFTYTVGSEGFSMKRYPEKPGAGKRPVVVLVHGVDGLGGKSGKQIEKFAERLAAEGLLVFIPSYFNKADGADTDPIETLVELRVPRIKTYLPRIAAAIDLASKRDPADGTRLGLVGFSLGGGLVLEYAESAPAGKIAAVVDFFGFVSDPKIYKNADKLPPTLVLHNNGDKIVDINYSRDLVDALKMRGVTNDHHFYDDGDPELRFHPFLPGGPDDEDSKSRTTAWLKTYLKP